MSRTGMLLFFLVFMMTGCATSFSGSAKVDGPTECRKTCNQWGMDLAGMVAMGRYTDGCICKVRGQEMSGRELLMGSAASVAGGVGVVMQMQQD